MFLYTPATLVAGIALSVLKKAARLTKQATGSQGGNVGMRKPFLNVATFSLVVTLVLAPWSASALMSSPVTTAKLATLSQVKMINYFPARHVWEAMWTHYERAQINNDMARIHQLNANTVRIIIQPDTIGFPIPRAKMMVRVRDVVQMAKTHGLQVQLTLFDLWSDYGNLQGSRTWAQRVLRPFRWDRVVQSVELKNEIDATDPYALAWAKSMIPFVRTVSGQQLVTISPQITLDSLMALREGLQSSQPDYYTYHYYDAAEDAEARLQNAKEIVGNRPLFIGETGTPSGYGAPNAPIDTAAENAQLSYLRTVEAAAQTVGLPAAAPWIFQDFAAGTFPAEQQARYHQGLVRLDGTSKPIATWLRSYFLTR